MDSIIAFTWVLSLYLDSASGAVADLSHYIDRAKRPILKQEITVVLDSRASRFVLEGSMASFFSRIERVRSADIPSGASHPCVSWRSLVDVGEDVDKRHTRQPTNCTPETT